MTSFQKYRPLIVAILFASALPLSSAIACTRNNHVRPADVMADEVNHLLEQKNYRELNRLYDKYSENGSVTEDRISSLSAFYKGISDSFNVCRYPSKTDTEWRAHQEALKDWQAFSPKAPGPRLALALFAVDYAFRGRGYGTADSVDPLERDLFMKRSNEAKALFDRLGKDGKKAAPWYAGMLYLGIAQGWDPATMDALYDKAVKLDPYYIDLHYHIVEFYSPRWYGSDAQMHRAIDRAAALTHEKLGETMYTRLHWTQSQSPTMFSSGAVDWQRMKTGFEDYLRIYSEKVTRNNFAVFACQANDRATLSKQMAQLGTDIDMNAWRSWDVYRSCMAQKPVAPQEKAASDA